ncbi:MAG: polyprenyl synthetase family protein [Methanomassiliicoccaceae archaeon]|jgi:octaprenyl-diphosphate synthase|nr:polyprenyl synthetase family protein [Methanomassiliicoccaceae archaeon]
MDNDWYAPISDDLKKVDEIIEKVLRSERPELQEMCDYVTSSGGKKIRPAMCILSHCACGGTRKDEVLRIAAAFEIIHDATLIHDDINDNGELRRGRKTMHKKYTVTKAIILGDFMFAMGFRLLGTMNEKIIETATKASAAMAESEFIQKEFEHRPAVTEKDYINIIRGKTAMPIFACARTGAHMADVPDDVLDIVSGFALDVGLAFQIVDDVLDIIGDHVSTGKKIGIDIAEGKPTLPMIYAMADEKNGKAIKKIFENREMSDEDVHKALALIKDTGAVDICISKAKEIVENAISQLSCLKDSVYKDSLIGLARYVVNRDR